MARCFFAPDQLAILISVIALATSSFSTVGGSPICASISLLCLWTCESSSVSFLEMLCSLPALALPCLLPFKPSSRQQTFGLQISSSQGRRTSKVTFPLPFFLSVFSLACNCTAGTGVELPRSIIDEGEELNFGVSIFFFSSVFVAIETFERSDLCDTEAVLTGFTDGLLCFLVLSSFFAVTGSGRAGITSGSSLLLNASSP